MPAHDRLGSDPAHDAPGLLWELEIDGVGANPCGRVEVTPTERRCHGFITPGQHFLRLRGVNGATAGGWSAAIVHTFIAPGPWTITATFSNETVVGIATDNAVDGGFVAGSQTTAFTVGSGSNRKMIVGVDANGGDTVTEVTYNGVSMFANLIAKTQDGTGAYNYAFYLDNPSSGTHNIVVSVSGSRNTSTAAVAYSGAAAGPPRVFGTDRNPTTVAIILTPPTDGCWIVLFAANHGMPNMDGGDAIIHGYDTGKSYQFLGDTGRSPERCLPPSAPETVARWAASPWPSNPRRLLRIRRSGSRFRQPDPACRSPYSVSATTGSMRVARLAGSTLAVSATIATVPPRQRAPSGPQR